MQITNKDLKNVISVIDEIIEDYKDKTDEKTRDWRTYEQRVMHRLQTAFRKLKPLVHKAVESIQITKVETRGAKSLLTLEQKVLILLLKHLFGRSNREMSGMFVLFSWLTDVSVSYKTVERLYSDQKVILALYNLHALILKKKGIKKVKDGSGDGTGYSLTVKKHYCSEAQRLKDKIKNNETKSDKRRKTEFVYSFNLMDLETRMYVGIGSSFKSEKEAFVAAVKMTQDTGICIESLRLDKYFSCQAYAKQLDDAFAGINLYLMPKRNATIREPRPWKHLMRNIIMDPIGYLQEYFKRNQSESGYAGDKKRIGWKLGQKRVDRIATANFCTGLWHNCYWLG